MESLLLILPIAFCYLSGIVLSWSALIVFNYMLVFKDVRKVKHVFRTSDKLIFGSIIFVAISIIVALFAVPSLTANIMDMMFILELWYVVFLAHISNHVTHDRFHIHKLLPEPITFMPTPKPSSMAARSEHNQHMVH